MIFLVKLDDIKTNLKNTRFFERIFGSTPEFIEKHVDKKEQYKSDLGAGETVITVKRVPSARDSVTSNLPSADSVWNRADENVEISQNPDDVAENEENATSDDFVPAEPNNSASISYEESDSQDLPEEERFIPHSLPLEANDTALSREESPSVSSNVETANAKLWFVAVDADGRIARKLCTRTIVRSTAPLTNNMKLLLQGPSSEELDSGCMSLIPEGTRLLDALVKDGVAYLNFSSEFETNRIGVEGYFAQLQQVIYTSTEFATVNSVQILIDGKKKDTLGDGVWIGSPLSRANFQ